MATRTDAARPLDAAWLEQLRHEVGRDALRRPLMGAIRKNGIQAVALNPDAVTANRYTFSVDLEAGPITNQRQSGRCWMFAGLNVLKLEVARRCRLKSFELSQSYLMFWDKLEKANYFLESILDTVDEDLHGRLVAWLLANPINDGGQWDMFVNLVEKYGVVPKDIMPDSVNAERSRPMNALLTTKLREDAARLRQAQAAGASRESLAADKAKMIAEIYRMLCHFLGEPPARFDFEYRDKDGRFMSDRHITPLEFYRRYAERDLAAYVSLIHAPTADKPLNRTYTVQYLGNVVEGRPVKYLNVDIEVIRRACQAQLEEGEVVWFGCDVGKMMDRDLGIMDPALFDYVGALGVPFGMSKAERLDYGDSVMTHAMVFTGVNVVDGRPTRWKVENSWGTEPGRDGWFVMADAWFTEFLYQAVVHQKHLTPELRAAWEEPPIVLPPWDPMGSLALMVGLSRDGLREA